MAEAIVGLEIKFSGSGADQVNAEYAKILRALGQTVVTAQGGMTAAAASESQKRSRIYEQEHAKVRDESSKTAEHHIAASKKATDSSIKEYDRYRTSVAKANDDLTNQINKAYEERASQEEKFRQDSIRKASAEREAKEAQTNKLWEAHDRAEQRGAEQAERRKQQEYAKEARSFETAKKAEQAANERAARQQAVLEERTARELGKQRIQQQHQDQRASALAAKAESDAANKQHLDGYRTLTQLEAQYAHTKTSKIVAEEDRLITVKKHYLDEINAATSKEQADEIRLSKRRVEAEIRGLDDILRKRHEVSHEGAGAILGRMGIGREITGILGESGQGVLPAIGSVAAAYGGTEILKKLTESGIEAAKVTHNLETAFEAAGVAERDMNRQMADSDRLASELSQKWNVFSDRTRQVETYIAQMGRVTGDQNAQIAKMSIAVEQATKDFGEAAITAEQFSKVFNVSDPEREVYLGRLKLKYRDLADELEHAKNTGEALTIAHQYLQPVMVEVAKRARDNADAWDAANNEAKEFWKTISKPVGTGVLYAIQILRQGPSGMSLPFLEKANKETEDFTERLNTISKFKHVDIDIDVAVKMSRDAFNQLKILEQNHDQLYGQAVDIPELVQPTIAKAKTIEEINRDHFAKEREQYDVAASARLTSIHVRLNDEVVTERNAKFQELQSNIELLNELIRITDHKKGLAKEHREYVEQELEKESEVRKLHRDYLKQDLEEYKQLYTEGIAYIKSVDDTAHANELIRLDEQYDARLLKDKGYQHAILEENLRFAKERLSNAGGDEKLVAEAKMQMHQAEHALNLERIHTEDELENTRRENQYRKEVEHWQQMKEIADSGISAAMKPLNDGIERNIALLSKDGNAFKQWAGGVLNVFARIGEKKLEQELSKWILGDKPEKQAKQDNASIVPGGTTDISELLKTVLPAFGDTPDTIDKVGYPVGGGQYALIGRAGDMLVSLNDQTGLSPITLSGANVFKAGKRDSGVASAETTDTSQRKELHRTTIERLQLNHEEYRQQQLDTLNKQVADEYRTDIKARRSKGEHTEIGLKEPEPYLDPYSYIGGAKEGLEHMFEHGLETSVLKTATKAIIKDVSLEYGKAAVGRATDSGGESVSVGPGQMGFDVQGQREPQASKDLTGTAKSAADSLKDFTQGTKLANAALSTFGKNGLSGNKDVHNAASMAGGILAGVSGIANILFPGSGTALSALGGIAGMFDGGTDYVPRTGRYLVGEHRAEVVELPEGAKVHPDARKYLSVNEPHYNSRPAISVNEPAYQYSNSGGGGSQSSGPQRMHPDDIQALAQAVSRIQINVDEDALRRGAGRSNARLANLTY